MLFTVVYPQFITDCAYACIYSIRWYSMPVTEPQLEARWFALDGELSECVHITETPGLDAWRQIKRTHRSYWDDRSTVWVLPFLFDY